MIPDWLVSVAGPGGAMILLGFAMIRGFRLADRWVDGTLKAFDNLRLDLREHMTQDVAAAAAAQATIAALSEALVKADKGKPPPA